jgi:quercetin dioxygenase-like cupin family protein
MDLANQIRESTSQQRVCFSEREESFSMTKPLVKPGETVDVRGLGTGLGTRANTLLIKTVNVEIIHVVIPAGETIPTHEAQGEIIFHCLEGRVSLSALGKTHELRAGRLFYFCINEPFSIHGIERASLLVTIIAPKLGQSVELIGTTGVRTDLKSQTEPGALL